MARLILLDDEGRQAMASEISPAVFAWLSQFVKINGGALRTVAAAIRVGRALVAAAASAPPPRRVAAAPRRRRGTGNA